MSFIRFHNACRIDVGSLADLPNNSQQGDGSCYGYCYGKQVECQRGFVGKILQIEGNGNP